MVRVVAVLLALLAVVGVVRAHPADAPAVWVDLHVQDGQVLYALSGRATLVNRWMGLPEDADAPARGAATEQALRTLSDWLAEHAPVHVDGVPVRGEPVEIRRPEGFEDDDGEPYLEARLAYPADGYPSRVQIAWLDYEEVVWQWREMLPVLIKSRGEYREPILNPEERSYTWHDESGERGRPTVEPLPPPPPPMLPLPLVSIGLGLAGVVGLVAGVRKGSRGLGVALLVFGLSVAGLARNVGVLEVESPFDHGVALPAQPQALQIFERLHQNVYGAFESASEDEIYDRLASSVDHTLLDDLYGDVYESLILRDEGGAVAVIDRVEVVERSVELPIEGSDLPQDRFEVEARWQVHCSVTHWGHRHQRINEYEARFVVRHDGYGWKLHEIEVLDERRRDVAPEFGVEPAPLDEGGDGSDASGGDR